MSIHLNCIKNNCIFVAIAGNNDNGENYINYVKKYKKIAVIISSNSKKQFNSTQTIFIKTSEVRKLFSEILLLRISDKV